MSTTAVPLSAIAVFSALDAAWTVPPSALRQAITASCRRNEAEAVGWLGLQAVKDSAAAAQSRALATRLMIALREKRSRASGVDALMHEFSLSSEEGIALMCLAEALLRIPDQPTADRLIADKISRGDWRKHLGASPSLFVNATVWGLLITGKLVGLHGEQTLAAALARLLAKGSKPLIRIGDAPVMLLLHLIARRAFYRIAPQPELLNEMLALGIGP